MLQKLLLAYNIIAASHQEYLDFIMGEFLPGLDRLGLKNLEVWHTAYGDYPIRLLAFVATESVMQEILAGETWVQLESKLKTYVTDYTRKVVPFKPGFQF